MKDAFGGIGNLVFIVVFLLIVIGVLGLVVSYTKAFKMKNEIISTIESYEGAKCNYDRSECYRHIVDKASNLGYSTTDIKCPTDFENMGLFCIKSQSVVGKNNYYIYTVVTQVNIDLPVINRIMGFRLFQVSGNTMPIELQS